MENRIVNLFRSQMENGTVFRMGIHLILNFLHLNQDYKRQEFFAINYTGCTGGGALWSAADIKK